MKRSQPSLWFPVTNIVYAQSGVFVIKADNNFTKRVPIQQGATNDSLIEIFGYLQAGDTVLKNGSEGIKEGIKINKIEL